MRTCVLVLGPQAAIRAAIARAVLPLGYDVEVASNEKSARQLLDRKRCTAAIIAAATFAGSELAFVHELHRTLGKLVLLADDPRTGERLAKSFPDALVCSSQRLEHEKIRAFLDNQTQASASAPGTAGATELLHFAGCTLDLAGRIFLDADGREVALTRREFSLLAVLARNCGRVLSRVQLRNAIDGGNAEAYDRSIDMLVVRLRRKIEADAAHPQFIVTVPGAGYKFMPRVHGGEPASAAAPASAGQLARAREAPLAERRLVTVLSCQILGFADLAAELDPEDLERTIGPVYAACTDVVARFNGTIMHSFGDAVLACFGYPKAEENHAESAVRAGLELLRTIRTGKTAPTGNFRARVGIATGLMVVGEPVGGTQHPVAVGAALNEALHMQWAAPADAVVIAGGTRELIGRFFRYQQIKPVEMEVGHEPAPAWRVTDETVDMARFDALRRDDMPALVGREAEMERLQRCWSKAVRGSGQVVLVTGEAGIGKSRLVIELQERLHREPRTMIRWFGLPHRSNSPMSAIIEELQRAAAFAADDAVSRKVEMLQREFAALGADADEATAMACALLGLPYEEPANISGLSPKKRKERTFAALLARLDAMTSRQPVVAVVEDVHWIDPTSLEFVTLLVERARAMRLLLVIVGRPEFVPPWPDHSHLTTLVLSRLSRSESSLLIEEVAGAKRIPQSIAAEIVARAEGVPLFLEELAKSILDAGAGGGRDARRAEVAAGTSIPATLQGLLLERFDRLGRAKEVAQAGAVIGREFSFELLQTVVETDDRLTAALDRLVASGLVFRHGSPPGESFVFKHALVRDAAYGILVRERRQALHARVARAYEEKLPEAVEAQPELLAYHCREGGDPAKAVGYLLKAAERALQRSATAEALSHLAEMKELIAGLPPNRDRLQLELMMEITLARASLAARGYAAPETREAYRRAQQRCEALGDEAQLPLIIHGQWLGAWVAADHRDALKHAQQLCLWSERNRDQVGSAMGHSDIGMTLTTLGRFTEAVPHLEQALQINTFSLSGRQPFVASDVDGRISALSFMHNCLLLLGFPDKAAAAAREAASLNPHNLYSRALAQLRMLRMQILARDALAAAAGGAELIRLSEKQGYPYVAGIAMIFTGWAAAQLGDFANGVSSCERGLACVQSTGGKSWRPLSLALLAESQEQAGDCNRAAASIEQALASVEASDERFWEPEIHRLKGRLLERGGDVDAASTCFVAALQSARTRQAKLLELRAAVSLAKLHRRKRDINLARDALAPVYHSFTEGFDFGDLRKAKALLDTLAVRA